MVQQEIYGPMEQSNSGAFMGTRMSLYINSQEDVTPPTVSLRKDENGDISENAIEKTTDSIKIKLDASDDMSGIKKYTYSISSDGGTTYKDYIAYGNTYKFEELTQKTNYTIKVKVEDHMGNITELPEQSVTTNILNVQKSDIYVDSVYGKNGQGVAYFERSEQMQKEGYTIEYQIINEDGIFSMDGQWTSGQQANNLSVGDTVYARITGGINKSNEESTVCVYNVSELETFSDTPYEALTEYVDENGDKTKIPAGFKVGTSSLNKTIRDGLVIENSQTGDQFVWVPVKNAIYDENDGTLPTSATEANKNKDENGNVISYKPMARYQKGYSNASENQYFEGVTYTSWGANLVNGSYAQRSKTSWAIGNNSCREPSLVTNSNTQYSWLYKAGTSYDADASNYRNTLKFEETADFGEYMNSEYTKMVQSVAKNGGFYVGRYETTLIDGTTVGSSINSAPMTNVDWYKMYYNQDSNRNENNPYYGNEEVTASMIWGSQWDAMLNWMLEGEDSSKVYTLTGNHSNKKANTGEYGDDVINNILDVGSNVHEWTLEAYGASYREYRGGYYYPYDTTTASNRNYQVPTYTHSIIGSRFTLYIK